MQFFASAGWRPTSPTSGGRSAPTTPTRSRARRRAPTAQAVLHPVLLLPVGALLPQERVREERLHGPEDAGRAQDAGRADEARRADADRVRRQGRLAGDGDLRHPQPAHQRLRLPHAADEGRGVLAGPEGRRPSSTPGASCCRCTRKARSAAPGRRRPERSPTRSPACTCSACSSASSSRARRTTTSTSSTSPRSTPDVGADTLDAPIDGFMLSKKPEERGGRQGAARVPRHRRGAEHVPGVGPEQHRHGQGRRHQRLQRAAEEGGRADRRRVEHHAVHGPRHAARTSPRR